MANIDTTNNDTSTTNDTNQGTNMLFEEPYNAIQPELKTLSPAELVPITIDIPTAVTTVLGVQPEVTALDDRIAKLPEFNVELPEKLAIYTMALAHAHTLHAMASAPASAIIPLAEEGTTLRATLLADANALVQRGLMDGDQLKDLTGPVGYKNLAFDLQILAQAFHNAAATVQGKCATTPAELLHANEIAAQLLKLAGLQEQGPATIAATADIRNRAFTLFVNAYDQVRRAVSYLRWDEGDVDNITPSLYAGRAAPKKKADVPAQSPSPSPGGPSPSNGTPSPTPATPVPASIEVGATNGAHTGPRAQPFVTQSDIEH
jgi:hypothetical protein